MLQLLILLTIKVSTSQSLEFKGSFSFSTGMYKKRTVEKRLNFETLRDRFDDHPCHGCLCSIPPVNPDEETWKKITDKSFVLFNQPMFKDTPYPYNSTESGCLYSPEEEYIGNSRACQPIQDMAWDNIVFFRCCDDLCARIECLTKKVIGSDLIKDAFTRSDGESAQNSDLCQISDADIDICKCQLESRGFDADKDCLLTDFDTSLESNNSLSSCIVYHTYHCRHIQ